MIDIEYVGKNFKIFVDTSALMYNKAEEFFIINFSKVLDKHQNKIIIPIQVIEDLKKFEKGTDEERRKAGRIGAKIVKKYQEKNLVDIRLDKTSSFTDHLFKWVAEYHREKHDICLFTQDKGLTYDLYKLKQSASVQHTTELRIFRLISERQLEEPEIEELEKNISKVKCSNCGKECIENKRRMDELKNKGISYICYECRHIDEICSICKKEYKILKTYSYKLKKEGRSYVCDECRHKNSKKNTGHSQKIVTPNSKQKHQYILDDEL